MNVTKLHVTIPTGRRMTSRLFTYSVTLTRHYRQTNPASGKVEALNPGQYKRPTRLDHAASTKIWVFLQVPESFVFLVTWE